MKKFLAVLLAGVLATVLLAGCSKKETSGEKQKLVMATEPTFAPYSYMNSNGAAGIDVEIGLEFAKDMGIELEVVTMDFDAVIPSVKSGNADFGASGISITEERMKEVDFTIPYATSVQVILTTDDSKIESVKDLDGKKVGVQLGTLSDLMIQEEYPKINLVQGKKYTDLAMDLSNGKIDAIVLDDLPAQAIRNANTGFRIVEENFFTDSYAFAVKKGDTETLESMNKTLERLIAEGKIEEYTEKHLQK